jgi:hypothetical protein
VGLIHCDEACCISALENLLIKLRLIDTINLVKMLHLWHYSRT